jgi:hypothetical protein
VPKVAEYQDLRFAMQQLLTSILARTSFKASRAHLKSALDEAHEYFHFFLLTIVEKICSGNTPSY